MNGASHSGRTGRPLRGLVYVSDETPGIIRIKRGRGFVYRLPNGRILRNIAEIQRIKSIAIPPAWTSVWICLRCNGHIQATGRDARGRKQYRYHVRWTIIRDENKYSRMTSFAQALPALRRRIRRDLATPGLSKRKVLATVVQLLNDTLIRVGNEEYARDNHSYGLTTFLRRHAKVTSNEVRFRFRGKSGKVHEVHILDKRLARIVKQCQELPGSQLFQYVSDTGDVHDISSTDVNAYLRSAMGRQFTAKDFRTWAGTLLAARTLASMKLAASKSARERSVVQAIDAVAGTLGNTRSICRKCYVHPAILAAFMEGRLGHGRDSMRRASRNGSISDAEILALVRRNGRRST